MSAAGRKLHLSQSAVSQTIQSLERQLGVQLLIRGAGGVTLTDAGTVLLGEARTLIAQHDRALATVSGQAAASTGPLRVGVPLEFPADLLPRALAEVDASFPQCQVDIRHASSSAQLSALQAGELDLALVRERPADPDYDAVLAVEEALGVVLSAERAAELSGPLASGSISSQGLSGSRSRAQRHPAGTIRSPRPCAATASSSAPARSGRAAGTRSSPRLSSPPSPPGTRSRSHRPAGSVHRHSATWRPDACPPTPPGCPGASRGARWLVTPSSAERGPCGRRRPPGATWPRWSPRST